MAGAQISELLDNDTLAQIERLRLGAFRRFTNRTQGEHQRGRGGSSIEFADFRDYQHGDDIRHLDWNAFARLQRPYLKLYRQEEELHLVILIDASASMAFGNKLRRAQELALACAVIGLWSGETVSIQVANAGGEPNRRLKPARGRGAMRRVIDFVQKIEAGGDRPIESAVDAMLAHHRGRGVCIVLSDFMSPGPVERFASALFAAGLEVFAAQILSPIELDPEIGGDVRLVDCETTATLDVSGAGHLLALYQEHLAAQREQLHNLTRRYAGRYQQLDCDEPFTEQLFDRLMRAGWVTR